MKIREYYKNSKNRITTSIFLITMFIACVPLMSRYCINGHDLEYHLLRIESLKEGILIGKPFLKVNTLFFGNAGYASSMFYPDFLLYIPAVLRVIGVSINSSYHIFIAVCIIMCYLSAYFCVKAMTGSTYSGMISAVTLSLCQYHLDDIYVRSAVGEYTAFIFVPIVIYAIYNIIYEKADKPQLFVLGYSGILLCHTMTFIMATAFGIAALLLNFKKTICDIMVLKNWIISTAVTILITCYYWLPMLEQFMNATFYVSTPWILPKDEAVKVINIFGAQFPSLGYLCVLMLIPRVFIRKYAINGRLPKDVKSEIKECTPSELDKKNINILGYADFLMFTGAMFTVLASDLIPWQKIGKYMMFIQFPWRFFIMGSALFSFAVGLIYSKITGCDNKMTEIMICNPKKDTEVINVGAVILTVVMVVNGISAFSILKNGSQGYYDYSDDYYSYKPFTASVIAGEWLPSEVSESNRLLDDSEQMVTDSGSKINFERIKNTVVADIDGKIMYVDVPLIYYLGYKAQITNSAGKISALPVTGEGHNGMCRVYMLGHKDGRLKVFYGGTDITHISAMVSIITVIVLILFWLNKKGITISKRVKLF